MAGLNKVQIIGHLGRDPETRYTNSGTGVCNFRVAVSKKWRDKAGEQQERTEWFPVVVWGKLAEVCQAHLSKGRQVYVEGRLQTRKWQDKDGADRYTTEVVADVVTFLGGVGGRQQSAPEPEQGSFSDDDIPF